MRHVQNSLMVLAVTVLTVAAVYAAVSGVGGTDAGTALVDASGTLTCPATGCTASTCHATQGSGSADASGFHGGRDAGWSQPSEPGYEL